MRAAHTGPSEESVDREKKRIQSPDLLSKKNVGAQSPDKPVDISAGGEAGQELFRGSLSLVGVLPG